MSGMGKFLLSKTHQSSNEDFSDKVQRTGLNNMSIFSVSKDQSIDDELQGVAQRNFATINHEGLDDGIPTNEIAQSNYIAVSNTTGTTKNCGHGKRSMNQEDSDLIQVQLQNSITCEDIGQSKSVSMMGSPNALKSQNAIHRHTIHPTKVLSPPSTFTVKKFLN